MNPNNEPNNEKVIAVNSNDEEIKLVDRFEAHTGNGILHRAFACAIFDQDNNILLTRRSPKKRLWDEYWDGSIASHPEKDQSYIKASAIRAKEELGIRSDQYEDINLIDKFKYKRYYLNEGLEYEVCAVTNLKLQKNVLEPDPEEVQGLLWIPYKDLKQNPKNYKQLNLCPWFEIMLRKYGEKLIDPIS